jgi:hypothetical protein
MARNPLWTLHVTLMPSSHLAASTAKHVSPTDSACPTPMIQQRHVLTEEHVQTEAGRAETACDSVLVRRAHSIKSTLTHCRQDNMHAGAPVYSCNVTDVDSYCCYENCKCENPFEVFSFDGSPSNISTMTVILEAFTQTHKPTLSAASSASVPSVTSAKVPASASTLPTGSTSAGAASATSQGTQNYVALGIGLGLGLGLGIPLIFLAVFFFWRRRKAAITPAYDGPAQPPELSSDEYYPPQQKYAYNHDAASKFSE